MSMVLRYEKYIWIGVLWNRWQILYLLLGCTTLKHFEFSCLFKSSDFLHYKNNKQLKMCGYFHQKNEKPVYRTCSERSKRGYLYLKPLTSIINPLHWSCWLDYVNGARFFLYRTLVWLSIYNYQWKMHQKLILYLHHSLIFLTHPLHHLHQLMHEAKSCLTGCKLNLTHTQTCLND